MLNIKPLKQKTGYTCGPTCVAMLARFYNAPLSWAEILRSCRIDRNGMRNEDLLRAIRKLRFVAKAKSRHTWRELREHYRRRLPVVVAWMLHGYIGHFSIVIEVGNRHVVLADPDTGRYRKLPKSVFMRLWFDYDDNLFPQRPKNIHLRWAVAVHGFRR